MPDLKYYKKAFAELKVNYSSGKPAPNKPCMLLAVIDQMETEGPHENCFKFEPQLLKSYDRYFKIVEPSDKKTKPYYPFVYLSSSGFWQLYDHRGEHFEFTTKRANDLAVNGVRRVTDTIKYARLNDDLFELLQDAEARRQLRQTLIEKWFLDKTQKFWEAIRETKILNEVNVPLTEVEQIEYIEQWRRVENYRDPKFRKSVLEAYGYRCAATGWQLRVPIQLGHDQGIHYTTLLEAAHIIPVSECLDNRIDNGIALIPTLHLAMDRHLIAPGPDYRWHVSNFVHERANFDEGVRQISELDNQNINLPRNLLLWPTQSALELALERLLE